MPQHERNRYGLVRKLLSLVRRIKYRSSHATHRFGNECSYYNDNPTSCRRYDDNDFSAYAMCCACGGGSTNGSLSEMRRRKLTSCVSGTINSDGKCVCGEIDLGPGGTYNDYTYYYSDCQIIGNYVKVQMCADCKDLKFLSNVESILCLHCMDSEGDFALNIIGNTELKSLDGVENITGTIKNIQVEANDILTSVRGLSGITTIEDELFIAKNPILESLEGLHNINVIYSGVSLESNSKLKTLEGLRGLEYIANHIYIARNPDLWSFSGMRNLRYVDQVYVRNKKKSTFFRPKF
jgi:hypothetical protein